MIRSRRFLVLLLVFVTAGAIWVYYRTTSTVTRDIEVLNPGGRAGTALLVFHPGMTDFQETVTRAFAGGLTAAGWRVELATANRSAPRDLARYDLLLVGGPTYFWTPAQPIRRYVSALGDLGGKRTVVLVTGVGATSRSQRVLEDLVRAAHGTIVASLALTTLRPNDETAMRAGEKNRASAVRIAREAASKVAAGS
jgi:flavorubredoxin